MVGDMEPLASILSGRASAASPSDGSPLSYASIPVPLELIEMDIREIIPKNLARLLYLRMRANPLTGLWETTTQDIADLLILERVTIQTLLRQGAQHGFIHVVYRRARLGYTSVYFGGFPQPAHIELGMAPLRWDKNDVPSVVPAATERRPAPRILGDGKPRTAPAEDVTRGESAALDTRKRNLLPNTNSESNESTRRVNIFSNDSNEFVRDAAVENTPLQDKLVPVSAFNPSNRDEETVRDLAAGLGEKYVNSFFSLSLRFGLKALQRTCGIAHGKLRDRRHPLREKPGAYVQWLLENGKC